MKKIFFFKDLYHDDYRWHIFPLIKFLKRNSELQNDLVLFDKLNDAEFVLLPMSWNYYYKTNQVDKVSIYLQTQNIEMKPVFSIVVGDMGSKVPNSFKGFVLRASGNKSKLSAKHLGLPIFVDDPLRKFYNTIQVFKRPFSNIPVVGFCGQASSFKLRTLIDISRVATKNILSYLGYSYSDPQKLMSTTYFRYKILSVLNDADEIKTNFIIRDQYRAGIKTDKDSHSSTIEFYDNIKNSDYVVCMRGAGNFSNRFYETLAMGRIPVFVNTDCLLPLEDRINWKNHVVWVEYRDRHQIAEKILEFHSKLDDAKLNALFESNRKLWENHLTLLPYFKTLLNESI